MSRGGPATAAVLALVACSASARAQGTDALAESLFRKARALMKSGDAEHACPLLAESQRLDPTLGTLLNLGICEEDRGRVATAWSLLREFLEKAPPSDSRRGLAERRLAAVEPRVPYVRLRGIEPSSGIAVKIDGTELRSAVIDTDVALDPGEHQISVELPNGDRRSRSVRCVEGRRSDVDLSAPLTAVPKPSNSPGAGESPRERRKAAQRVVPATKAAEPSAAPRAAPPAPDPDSSGLYTAALWTGGIGTASLVTSAVFAGLALAAQRDANSHCPDKRCDDTGYAAVERGRRYLNWTNGFAAVGALGIAAGGILLWRSSTESVRSGVSVDAASAELTCSGTF